MKPSSLCVIIVLQSLTLTLAKRSKSNIRRDENEDETSKKYSLRRHQYLNHYKDKEVGGVRLAPTKKFLKDRQERRTKNNRGVRSKTSWKAEQQRQSRRMIDHNHQVILPERGVFDNDGKEELIMKYQQNEGEQDLASLIQMRAKISPSASPSSNDYYDDVYALSHKKNRSEAPSLYPSVPDILEPTTFPSSSPQFPSAMPSFMPSSIPSNLPTSLPSSTPSFIPSATPSVTPSAMPSSCDGLLTVNSCTDSDCNILRDFFLSTGGCTSWINRENWLQSDDVCEWHGISCAENLNGSQGFEVTEINLSGNGLRGTIPYNVGGLFFLNQIDLSYNYLTGSIPVALGALSLLENFNIASNAYDNLNNSSTGVIPSTMCDLFSEGALNQLVADCDTYYPLVKCTCCTVCLNEKPSPAPSSNPSNILSSSPTVTPPVCEAPTDFSCLNYNLRNTCEVLVEFYESTGGCYWTNGSDNWLNTENLPSISTRDPFCDWYGVTCETDCVTSCDVVGLDLWNNNLNGTLPESLFLLSELQSVELRSNRLSGTIPTTLALLPSLTRLVLDGNRMTGSYNYGSTSNEICSLVESGILRQFWMDCNEGDSIDCDCCNFCGY